ncbi:uncharacterized protein LOC135202194 [Macrobrachium nipponense]|uniref:uncharacterized protein LOC135202194 n=1 Tax=Macrobrachium nipponense TaxID=159736 RepID=UPI0030C89F07
MINWNDSCLEDLQWWSEEDHLTTGVSLALPIPDVHLYSDASDQGWGATLEEAQVKGLWRVLDQEELINFRELRAIEEPLLSFKDQVLGKVVALFSDNATALAYLKKEGGTRSSTPNIVAQRIFQWCESHKTFLLPQFIEGKLNVLADALPFERSPRKRMDSKAGGSPITVKEVASHSGSVRHKVELSSPGIFLSGSRPYVLRDGRYAPPVGQSPFGLIHQILAKLRGYKNMEMTLIALFWPQRPWFPDLMEVLSEPLILLPRNKDLLKQPHFHHYHKNLPVLNVAARRLCSEQPEGPVFRKEWLDKFLFA